MRLSKKQALFSVAVANLILYADGLGYELTLADAYRDPRLHGAYGVKKGYGHKKSNHKKRLAVDFNLYIDGEYITESEHEAWGVLHQYWETHLGGATMILGDAGHFSFEHKGII